MRKAHTLANLVVPNVDVNGRKMVAVGPHEFAEPQTIQRAIDDFLARFHKVSVTPGGAMHVDDPDRKGQWTLCGRAWHYHNDHGDTYCRNCQTTLARRQRGRQAKAMSLNASAPKTSVGYVNPMRKR